MRAELVKTEKVSDTMTKLTNKTAIEMALSFVPAEETALREKLEKIAEGFAKKSTAERKPSAKQVENDEIRIKILDFLLEDTSKGFRISEICAAVPELEDASSQRVSGLLRPLILHGRVTKFVDKRASYFQALPLA